MGFEYFFVFLKGVLMGVCDLIPGISGGTIAFITGIYERLILAVKNLTPRNYFRLIFFSKNRKRLFWKLDVLFLFCLFFGIFFAILVGARVVSFLIESFYVYVFAFFTGLILSSSFFIFKQIDVRSNWNYFVCFLGFLGGVSLLFFSSVRVLEPSDLFVLFGGFMAIFALFLPGISGSFILVILGLYEYVIGLVKSLDVFGLLPFVVGAGVGVVVISRLIHFLFEKDKSKSLFFLVGLVFGTLLIPVRNIFLEVSSFSFGLVLNLVVLAVFGFFVVRWIER